MADNSRTVYFSHGEDGLRYAFSVDPVRGLSVSVNMSMSMEADAKIKLEKVTPMLLDNWKGVVAQMFAIDYPYPAGMINDIRGQLDEVGSILEKFKVNAPEVQPEVRPEHSAVDMLVEDAGLAGHQKEDDGND